MRNLNIYPKSSIHLAGQGEPLQYLPPADPLGQRFTHWFYHGWRFLYAPVPAWGDRPDWKLERRYPMDARALWRDYQHPDWLLGLSFGEMTHYLLIDLDAHSQFHPQVDWQAFRCVLWALEAIGLCRPVSVQSSGSGGVHVYYFLSEAVHSFTLACTVRGALWHAGIALKPGKVEQFPNCKPYNGWFKSHRLPMQDGSYLLDDDLEPCSAELEAFLDASDSSAAGQDLALLQQAMRQVKSRKQRGDVTLGDTNRGWKVDLEEAIAEGWNGYHQTNQLLYRMATYVVVWLGLSGEAAIDWTVNLAVNAPGYRTWCRHQHEIRKRCGSWVRSCESFYSAYPSRPQRILSFREHFALAELEGANNVVSFTPNAERQRQTEIRLRDVVALLQSAGALPAAAAERSRAIIAKSKEVYGVGMSQTTLHKPSYLPLWHPDRLPAEVPSYPMLSDPWEDGLAPCVNPDPVMIYTRLPYMEVFGLSQCLLSPAPDTDGDPDLLTQPEVEILDPVAVSLDLLDSSPVQNFSNESPPFITATYPYLSGGEAHSAYQQNLSVEEPSPAPLNSPPNSPLGHADASSSCNPTCHPATPTQTASVDSEEALPLEFGLDARRRSVVEHQGVLLYQGPSAHTLVRIAGQRRMLVRGVRTGTEVVLCPDAWSMNPHLVFVKPLHGADDWLGGVQVRWECLLAQPPPASP